MANLLEGKALRQLLLGKKVERATSAMTTTLNLFDIEVGRVMVTQIIGQVTSTMEAAASLMNLSADPDAGTTNVMSVGVEMNAAEIGTMYTITGLVGETAILGKSGAVSAQQRPAIVAPGNIEVVMVAPLTGSMKWTLFYIPIDDGAYVTAS